ncbi:fungal-specific transcription factor domain-containing protein [Penicillium atrosanguineum]|nr:uncharacterized protein N7443_000832 [Penicillium atrosanguineum]KAJ5127375.1 fungal-specific transcription factor domain-containing protein [Penicillium atrosanguineum]KAJ5147577.1 fungal-specific transcription factor domain-containing protein [Penicillium atrosanguineum]KAJ5313948.1 hypothetical protein N7443_000832 [Penicillium atrosanguineum]
MSQNSSAAAMNESSQINSIQNHSAQSTPSARHTLLNPGLSNIEDEQRNGIEIAEAALGQPRRIGEVPFYTGDQTGPTSALNICSPDESLPKHFLIPASVTELSNDDREFLQKKGVYNLPKNDTCDRLIAAYLLHVHPIMPVIEADDLLLHYQAGKLQYYNLSLLWSIFFAATNFVSNDIPEEEGYSSRREMKYAFYSRAKCMYRNGNERNKIVLLQTSLLLGFFHSEMDEHGQPWYWTGIAISFCQILGLHRNPDFSKRNPSITERQRSFWRRLWWSCVFRDRWLSLTMGRPLRINLDDCDTPFPSPDDLLYDIVGLQEPFVSSYIPSDMARLAKYWVMLISLSLQLGSVLAMNYRTVRPKPSVHEIGALEERLLQCDLPDQYEAGLTKASRFYSNHVHLHYQALLITFYRPFGTDVPRDLQPVEKEDWQHRLKLKADAAASRANEILEALVQEGLLYFAGPMTPPLLVPAMQTHLLQCKTGDALSKRIRLNKLEMCMLVMEEFQKTYTVASLYRGIFVKAIEQIFPGYSAPTTYPKAITDSAVASDTGIRQENFHMAPENSDQVAQFDDTQFGNVDGNNLMSALMDEASIFSFWESWNQI